jgi:hypothetical protein
LNKSMCSLLILFLCSKGKCLLSSHIKVIKSTQIRLLSRTFHWGREYQHKKPMRP